MAGDERIRLFCALQLPADALDWIEAWADAHVPAGTGRRVRREDLHVTLAFLGHRPAEDVAPVARALREASGGAGPIELRVGGYRETPSVGMLVCADVGGAATALAADLQQRLEHLGVYRREERAWLPHVTILRTKGRAGVRAGDTNTCSIHVVRSALYRSSLGPGGARYDALETAALGGS